MKIPIISPAINLIRKGIRKVAHWFRSTKPIDYIAKMHSEKAEARAKEEATYQYAINKLNVELAIKKLNLDRHEIGQGICSMALIGRVNFHKRDEFQNACNGVVNILKKLDSHVAEYENATIEEYAQVIDITFKKLYEFQYNEDLAKSDYLSNQNKRACEDEFSYYIYGVGYDNNGNPIKVGEGVRDRLLAIKALKIEIQQQEKNFIDKYKKIPTYTWQTPNELERKNYDYVWVNPLEANAKKTPRKESARVPHQAPGAPLKPARKSFISTLSPFKKREDRKIVVPESPYRPPIRGRRIKA